MLRSYVFFHAHPDDESLLTAGTMARLAATGQRVVLVVATAGEAGLAVGHPAVSRLRDLRMAELRVSARALGCARVHHLGFADSGCSGEVVQRPGLPEPFARTNVEHAAQRLASLLDEEDAQMVTSYDAAGGYGHPDHVQVHRVAARAARLAGTPVLLEATVNRELLLAALRVAAAVGRPPGGAELARFRRAYTPARQISHRIDVRCYIAAKRESMTAHVSQTGGGTDVRTLDALLRLPQPIFRWVCGTEWYVRRDPLAPLRDGAAG